jgi:hypothetical protein
MMDASAFQDIARSAARHADEVQRMLKDFGLHGLVRSAERHAASVQSALNAVAGVQAGIARTRTFADICVQLKWPPPWHMPARVIDRIAVAYQAGKLTPEETARIFSSFYTPEQIREFGQRWAGYDYLGFVWNPVLGTWNVNPLVPPSAPAPGRWPGGIRR